VTAASLQVGERVWVGVASNEVPGHLLSIRPLGSGQVEYVVRTLDLAGRPGENLNLRVYDGRRSRVLRPREAGTVGDSAALPSEARHGSR